MRIRAVRASELPVLQAIERAAGQSFAEIGMAEIAQYEPYPLPLLAAREQAGLLWVTADEADEPVAYLMASLVDDCLHIDQVSVHPGSARRRLGRALLEHAAGRAAADGLAALTLTTFAAVPWNAPYYRRCGFRVLGDGELTPGLQAIRRHEAELGLDRWPRLCMRRDLQAPALLKVRPELTGEPSESYRRAAINDKSLPEAPGRCSWHEPGSLAQAMLQYARCPAAVIHPPQG